MRGARASRHDAPRRHCRLRVVAAMRPTATRCERYGEEGAHAISPLIILIGAMPRGDSAPRGGYARHDSMRRAARRVYTRASFFNAIARPPLTAAHHHARLHLFRPPARLIGGGFFLYAPPTTPSGYLRHLFYAHIFTTSFADAFAARCRAALFHALLFFTQSAEMAFYEAHVALSLLLLRFLPIYAEMPPH